MLGNSQVRDKAHVHYINLQLTVSDCMPDSMDSSMYEWSGPSFALDTGSHGEQFS